MSIWWIFGQRLKGISGRNEMARALKASKEAIEWMRDFENRLQISLFVAYMDARKGGKRRTADEHRFELNADANLKILRKAILNKTYLPSRSRAHIIHNPVIREIFAASFIDRVVHHLLFGSVYEWWDRHLIDDAYSCRLGKGTKYGIERLDYHIRSASKNYKEKVWVLKLDIQGYFMSLPRKKLYERAIWGLERQFNGREDSKEFELLKYLWFVIIFDDPTHGAKKVGDLEGWRRLPASKSLFKQLAGVGIVIGNLTSQLLSNIYLDQLDRFIMYKLGYKHYGRYVDDFYIVVTKDQLPQLKRDIKAIERFLKTLGLTLHPRKRMLQESSKGVPFLGVVVYHNHIVPGKRMMKNAKKAFREVEAGMRGQESVISYMGHMKHMNSKEFLKTCFEAVGWDYNL